MLIEFSVTNYRSFRDPQAFSMVASPAKELRQSNTFSLPDKAPRLLKSAAVYGPNAGGKSNFFKAIQFMQLMVTTSAIGVQPGQTLSVKPFVLTKKASKAPTDFQVIFVEGGVRYQYGFSLTATDVLREWLIAYPTSRPQRWFTRSYNPRSKKNSWTFGPKFRGPHKVWRDATRNNALFLSTAVQLNNEQLRPVFDWFQHKLTVVVSGVQLNPILTYQLASDPAGKSRVIDFLRAADVGIDDVEVKRQPFGPPSGPMPPGTQGAVVMMAPGQLETITVKSLHKSQDSKALVPLDMSEESDGTQKLFLGVGAWIRVLTTGSTVFIDELDNSLHPKIVRFLVELFHHPIHGKSPPQLIFSTHDTSLLRSDLFRRDQIWFVEKNKKQSSTLYSLSEFSPRANEAFEKNYLAGRYGGLPIVGAFGRRSG